MTPLSSDFLIRNGDTAFTHLSKLQSLVSDKVLIKFALNYLPPYKIPKSFEHIDHIPRNESGKVVRSQMVEDYLKRHADTCSSSNTKGEKHGD